MYVSISGGDVFAYMKCSIGAFYVGLMPSNILTVLSESQSHMLKSIYTAKSQSSLLQRICFCISEKLQNATLAAPKTCFCISEKLQNATLAASNYGILQIHLLLKLTDKQNCMSKSSRFQHVQMFPLCFPQNQFYIFLKLTNIRTCISQH